MSTENVEVFNKYYGNGVATQFSIGFPYLRREFVKVYLYKKETNEEVMLSSDQFAFVNDATIEYPVLPTDEILKEGDILTIQRETELGSDFEFDNQRRLFPVEVMNADDLSFQQIQELAREVKRSVRVTPTAQETPEELLTGVYDKLDSATSIAGEAIAAAEQATIAAEQATTAVEEAKKQVIATQEYIDEKRAEVDTIVAEAEASVDDAITQATEDVKQAALEAAQESIDTAAEQATAIVMEHAETVIKPQLNEIAANAEADAENAAESAEIASNESDEAKHWAEDSRVWATGEDAEVEEIAPGEEEHSSRGYADLAMAIANTPEDVPVDTSKLLALQIIKGPKGDSSVGSFTGDNTIEGTLNVKDDSNHPLKITGMAGTSATGFQIVDSLGAGDSDFEHYATGDRCGTRITNHNNTSNTSVSVDLYQSNVGKSVLDLSNVETILAPSLLGVIYPVGSIYITTNATCPIADLGVGTWELVAEDRVLQGAGTRGAVGTELAESLPSHNHTSEELSGININEAWSNGVILKKGIDYSDQYIKTASIDNPTYQDGAPVQPDAYLVNIFRRTM